MLNFCCLATVGKALTSVAKVAKKGGFVKWTSTKIMKSVKVLIHNYLLLS